MTRLIAGIVLILAVIFLISNFLKTNQTSDRQDSIPRTLETRSRSSEDVPQVSIIQENLNIPWALAFLPDGRLAVTERPGRVLIIDENGQVLEIANINVHTVSESGLHGIAVDPNFDSNNYIYLYYTYSDEGNNTLNRVVRYRLEGNNLREDKSSTKLVLDKIIVDRIPGASNHDGGRIKFGPDGFLYITTGDAQQPSLAQDRNSLAGKILRVDRDGDPAPGNPFGTRIYSYGHRNSQGIAWQGNKLWEIEHGSSATDELNLIEPGKNYGWPEVRGDQTKTGMVSPINQSGNQTWAPGGAAFLLPAGRQGNGSIFFAGLRGSALYEYKISEGRLVEHFKNKYGRIREVIIGPDNMLYVTTSNRDGRGNPRTGDDKILRINPSKL